MCQDHTCIPIFCIPLATGKYDNIGFPRVVKTLTGKMIAAGGQQVSKSSGTVAELRFKQRLHGPMVDPQSSPGTDRQCSQVACLSNPGEKGRSVPPSTELGRLRNGKTEPGHGTVTRLSNGKRRWCAVLRPTRDSLAFYSPSEPQDQETMAPQASILKQSHMEWTGS